MYYAHKAQNSDNYFLIFRDRCTIFDLTSFVGQTHLHVIARNIKKKMIEFILGDWNTIV
jgi:hypothetical protein